MPQQTPLGRSRLLAIRRLAALLRNLLWASLNATRWANENPLLLRRRKEASGGALGLAPSRPTRSTGPLWPPCGNRLTLDKPILTAAPLLYAIRSKGAH